MSTQDATGIEFSILPEDQQQQFRLLELPPELLELLTSDNAPTLQLKSLPPTPGQPSEPPAVLCTSDKTYTLRQVNTSNSLYVTSTNSANPLADELPKPSLSAIAKADFTLELQPATNVPASTHIKAILPVYASTGHFSSKDPISKDGLFANVPASNAECERAWQQLACFELEGEALIPSASVKVAVWEAILSAATADGIDLASALHESQVESLCDLNGTEWPRELSLAILRSMAQLSAENDPLILDAQSTARTIGHALLKTRADPAPIVKSSFLSAWSDLVPEKWRSSAQLSLLDGSYRLEGSDIVFDDGASGGASALPTGTKAPAEAKSALGAKRKWHEKFRGAAKKAG